MTKRATTGPEQTQQKMCEMCGYSMTSSANDSTFSENFLSPSVFAVLRLNPRTRRWSIAEPAGLQD